MIWGQVWRYAYGGAKVMALKSQLLTPEDYHFLLVASDSRQFLTLCKPPLTPPPSPAGIGGALTGKCFYPKSCMESWLALSKKLTGAC